MCEREYDYHRFNNEYVYPQSIQDKEICIEKIYNNYEKKSERDKPLNVIKKEILDKLYSKYGRNFRLLSGFGWGKEIILYVQCEYREFIYYFDREYSTREWNLKLLREKGID